MKLRIDGGILAGGLSTRMGGQDKGLQLHHNKVMALSVYESLQPFVDKVIINCNRNRDEYRKISPYLCSDSIEGFQGPLAGLHSIMLNSDADYLLVSPCDTPCLGTHFGKLMIEALYRNIEESPNKPLIIAAKDERSHPLHCCISRKFIDSLEEALLNKQHRVMQWMNDNDAIWVDFSEDSNLFLNFNRLDELGLR
jgi:molybdopterin-guanine dinucleotide biosynthesis protein A